MRTKHMNVGGWMAGLAGVVLGMAQGHGQVFLIDLAAHPIQLAPNQANQKVVVTASNIGGQAEQVIGGYLTFQVDAGFDDANVPAITAVDFITGTPWAGLPEAHITTQTVATSPQFWTVQYLVDFTAAPVGTSVTIPQGQFRLGEITLDTTNLELGNWRFVMKDVESNLGLDSFFIMDSGAGVGASATVGTVAITEVPEPMEAGGMAALGLLGWCAIRGKLSRKNPCR